MNMPLYFRAGSDDASGSGAPWLPGYVQLDRAAIRSTALWAYLMVATSLFFLFIVSYLIRMQSADWRSIAMPWQVWLSTACLVCASAAIHLARTASESENVPVWRHWLQAAGLCMLAFLLAQAWTWHSMLLNGIAAAGNPAAGYFYLLTAAHGLHVAGGIVAWLVITRVAWHGTLHVMPAHSACSTRLCARYWHFLLLAWVAMVATMTGVTRDVVGYICGAG